VLTKIKGSIWDSGDNGLPVNVKDYGAIGDGVTDDTDAMEAAIDYILARGNGTISIPVGIYNISTIPEKDTVNKSISLIGEGRGSIINVTNTTGDHCFMFTGGGDWRANYIEKLHFIGNASCGEALILSRFGRPSAIRDCIFTGFESAYPIQLDYCLGIRVEQVSIDNSYGGIHLRGGSDAAILDQVTVYDYGSFGTAGRGVYSSELTFDTQIDRTSAGIILRDCYFYGGNADSTGVIAVELKGCKRSTISSMWTELNETAVKLTNGPGSNDNSVTRINHINRSGGVVPMIDIEDCSYGIFDIGESHITLSANSKRNTIHMINADNATDNTTNNENTINAVLGRATIYNYDDQQLDDLKIVNRFGSSWEIINDDTAVQISDIVAGAVLINGATLDVYGLYGYKATPTGWFLTMVSSGITAGGKVANPPTGTTGADGDITFYVVEDGTLWLENRYGTQKQFYTTTLNNILD
jgi:hypothetical protein